MRYLSLILLWLIGVYFFVALDSLDNGWQLIQPFLIFLLLLYFNSRNILWSYSFALLSGLFLDSLTGVFGLQTIIFLVIVFLLRSLQLTILSTKSVLSTLILIIFSFLMFWLLFWAANFIFSFGLYHLSRSLWLAMLKTFLANIALVILLQLLYYNLYAKKHERQSF